ncbi:hypothetical protein LEP1GSC083_4346 [Leptospira interrogans serovar Pyrogenes str. L0374]|uniref:Uncharacterized protein n=1 Tax=Leptospira interrogans serovar Pyrogenes str. L0374 TaxID=1049928 RepID=M6K4H4_LEPIR|nr:hypothetical protein LEP1GSC083_4346 [Leptospira interrogans serovar Pyrogenes str. L0374]
MELSNRFRSLQQYLNRIPRYSEKRKPFWITMSRHERWAVPIGLI